jgi:tetratricopeptide (TPR) repeat protein
MAWVRNPNDPNRVVALIAPGGTGKTALAERVLSLLADYSAAGVFVWSFYEDKNTLKCLTEASQYFFDAAPRETGRLLEHLQDGFRDSALPHLLILDGLELVQADENTGRARGALEEMLLRRFVTWIASGHGVKVKTLITSRYPLPDLANWEGVGYCPIELEDLEPEAALALLRRRGVRGTDDELNALAEGVHYHALAVDFLGMYLHRFGNGDPANAPELTPDAVGTLPKGQQLSKVLGSIAKRLADEERDLLARLSTFPSGLSVGDLQTALAQGEAAAGSLAGSGPVRLLQILRSLQDLGFVFRSDNSARETYTAHPLVREYYQRFIGTTERKQVHRAVARKRSLNLSERPQQKPTAPADLDRYEQVIESTLLAGDPAKAFELYRYGLGGYDHLDAVVGDDARGMRVLRLFSTDGTPATAGLGLPEATRTLLVNDWGLFAVALGDLVSARQAVEIGADLAGARLDHKLVCVIYCNLAHVEMLAGRWPAARDSAIRAQEAAAQSQGRAGREMEFAYTSLAAATAGLGEVAEARRHFAAATALRGEPVLVALGGVWEAEFKLATGDPEAARTQTETSRTTCLNNDWKDDAALCETILGRCHLPFDDRLLGPHRRLARLRRWLARLCRWFVLIGVPIAWIAARVLLGVSPGELVEPGDGEARSNRAVGILFALIITSFVWFVALWYTLPERWLVALQLTDPPPEQRLAVGREHAGRTGDVELTLRCHLLAAEIARRAGNYRRARSEALDGIQLADSSGFGRWQLDLRLELARIHLTAGNPHQAVEPAEWVLKRSQAEGCRYAWGVADGFHLLGIAYARLGNAAKAADALARAIDRRKPLGHPGLADSEAAYGRLTGTRRGRLRRAWNALRRTIGLG